VRILQAEAGYGKQMTGIQWLKELESDLKHKRRRPDPADTLAGLASDGDIETRRKAVWCAAKLGQNKLAGIRSLSILIAACGDTDAQIREDAAWGIGESVGTMYDECIPDSILGLLHDDESSVRGMAAWAAGRLFLKRGIRDERIADRLTGLSNDGSGYVRSAADFALDMYEKMN